MPSSTRSSDRRRGSYTGKSSSPAPISAKDAAERAPSTSAAKSASGSRPHEAARRGERRATFDPERSADDRPRSHVQTRHQGSVTVTAAPAIRSSRPRSSPSTGSRPTSTSASSRCSAATPTFTELGDRQRAVERALLVQALAAAAAHAADQGAVRAAGAGRERRRHRRSATGWPSRSRSSRTTTRRPSSRTRARRPASAASCATSSRWARARSRCSTRCASARSTRARVRYLFAGVVKGIGDYGNCVGIPTVAGEVVFDPAYEGNPLVNAMCVGLHARGGADSRRGRGRRQPDHRRRRAHRPRRHSRRVVRVGGPVGGERREAPARAGRRPVHREAAARGVARADPQRAHRRHPGHGRGRPHVVVGGDGGARRRRRRRSTSRRCRCARRG